MLRRVDWPHFTTWVGKLPVPVRESVVADLAYFQQFGRAATEPYAKQAVVTSSHHPDMAETRSHITHEGRRWVVRCLVVIADRDRVMACCIGGDKATWERSHPGQDWYDTYVPAADQIYALLRRQQGWP